MHCGSWQSEMVVEKPMAPPVVELGGTAYALPQSIMHLRELSLHVTLLWMWAVLGNLFPNLSDDCPHTYGA